MSKEIYKAYIYSKKFSRGILLNKFRNKIPPILLIIFISILGYIAGVVTIALWQENWLVNDGILNQDFIYKIEDLNVDKRALFFLCLGKRLRAFFLLFLLAFSSVNVFSNIIYFFMSGLYIGSIMELFIIRYGMQGLLMYLSFVLPQGIFYIIGFLVLGCWCLGQERRGDERRKKKDKIHTIRDKGRLGISLVLIFVGIILECYVNSKIFLLFC